MRVGVCFLICLFPQILVVLAGGFDWLVLLREQWGRVRDDSVE